jgi:aminopeptidase N
LVGASGDLPLNSNGDTEMVYEISQTDQQLIIENVGEAPVPSLLREFSAPIKLDYAYSKEQLLHLMANDSDGFNRWDAGQKLSFALLEKLTADSHQQRPLEMDSQLIAAYKSLLSDPNLDPAMVALMLQLPSEAQLHEEASVIYAEAIHSARLFVRQALASALSEQFVAVYERHNIEQEYAPNASQIGRRSLKNTALSYLMLVENMGVELASKQFETADNMTDKASALSCLVNCPAAAKQAEEALQQFEQQYRDEALVMNLWLQVQAANSQPGGLQRVEELEAHSSFTLSNPNKIRSLIGGFCNTNLVNFHNPDGSGYEFLKKRILTLHSRNPQVAARLMTPLTRWKKFPEPNSSQMREALQVIADEQGLVKDIYEIAIKSLQ